MLPVMQIRGIKRIAKIVQLIIYLIILVIPISALVITLPLILPLGTSIFYMALVILMQFILLLISGSFFSALLVKRELGNTITNLTIISDQINDSRLNKSITEEKLKKKLKKLKQQYSETKLYVHKYLVADII